MPPRVRLSADFYGIVDACELIIEHSLATGVRFSPGHPECEQLDDVMECIVHPSIYLLDCALRPANRGWLAPYELTMLELIFVHDALANIMGILASLPFLFRALVRA